MDCSTLSLGNICTHFWTTNTAKPVSIFFLYTSPSSTFTLTQNESLASQSFLTTYSFEKWCNSHFREGLVSAEGFLNCQIAGVMAHGVTAHSVMAHASSVHAAHPDSPWQLLHVFSQLCIQRAGKETPLQPAQCTQGTARWLQSSHQTGPACAVSFHCQLCVPLLSKLLIFFQELPLLPCTKRDTFNLYAPRLIAPSSVKTDRRKTQHTQVEPTFNKMSSHGKFWASS